MRNAFRGALLAALLLVGQTLFAQTINELPKWLMYPGLTGEKALVLPLVDSLKVVTATAYSDRDSKTDLGPTKQPTVTRTTKQRVVLRFPNTTVLPTTAYLKIKVDGVLRFGVVLSISTQNVNISGPGEYNILYPVAVEIPGSGVSQGQVGQVKYYNLTNAVAGQVINHSGFTRLVTGTAFPQNTVHFDPLWRVEVATDNTVILRGPTQETFNGTLVLMLFKQTNQ